MSNVFTDAAGWSNVTTTSCDSRILPVISEHLSPVVSPRGDDIPSVKSTNEQLLPPLMSSDCDCSVSEAVIHDGAVTDTSEVTENDELTYAQLLKHVM